MSAPVPDQPRAGDTIDWDVERRRWAKLRAEVRQALTAGAADYVAQPVTVVVIPPDHSEDRPPPAALHKLAKPNPAPKVRTPIDPPPVIVPKPKVAGVPKTKLNIKADDLPMGMETLAQSWKKPNV